MKEILKLFFFVLWSQEGCFIHAENFHRNKLKLSSCLLFGYVSAHCKNAVWCLANRGSWMWNGVPELPLKFLPSFRCRGKNREKENEQKTEWENFPVVRIKFAALWSFLRLLFSFTLALFSPGVSAGMMKQNTKHKEGSWGAWILWDNTLNMQMYSVNSNSRHPRGFSCHIICECRTVGVNNYCTLFCFMETKSCRGRYCCFHSVLIMRSQYNNLIING